MLIQVEWNKIKADKITVDEYIKARSGELDFTRECADDEIKTKVKDYGFELLPATQAPSTNKDSPTIDAQQSTSTSILPHSFRASKFDALCPGLNVLTDDVVKNTSFMSCIQASEGSILHFMKLRSMYTAKKQRDRETQLKKDLEKVDAAIISVQHIARKVSLISVNPSIGLDPLTQRCVEKQQLLKDLGQSLLALKALVACPQLTSKIEAT